jgi:UDP-N-acetylmuramoyl-tripeptide--D-alanyl-D-alanine ligase
MRVCLDNRLIKKGEYFVPIKGENFDGHDFIGAALEAGAGGIIEEEDLYKLAQKKLNNVKPVIVGIAGSVGKSTARAYLTQVLSAKKKVLEGDLNTKLGLSVNIVNNLTDQEVFVAELGIDRVGEMKLTTDFLKPDFVMITKLEKEHLQFLHDLKTVVKENLVAVGNSRKRLGYVNRADEKTINKKDAKIIYYSKDDQIDFFDNLELPDHDKDYLAGILKIVNDQFGFSDEDFKKALRKLKKPKGRLNLIEGENDCLIVDDSYNAVCDESVIAGVKYAMNLANQQDLELLVLLSPMRETGESEQAQHRQVAEFLNNTDCELILVGDDRNLYGSFLKRKFEKIDMSESFTAKPCNKIVYIKGSQFYRMEKIVYKLMKNKNKASELLVRQDDRWK